ncbi:bifunctional heptose 7-phosphate kinase/heptose 1-phosphate adenyltransferase [Rubripirellula amarantea]|uniref:Bifunctional heptose 7-phosphate kinase/heptose 1-phosphate adenyltransferase n=1 Tax=Rubripirellula amarantea TaxID=2527999 RepID=A0A5C5WG62_9BACT|nr:hypothetical protein [Rubripirellula amarantea]TWT49640.1 bifunctional heptose 7-phosphate kinase/heptose 1-phosphate adenyltransferase [Rubripirellula amarantea]
MKILTSGFFDQLNPSQLRFLQSAARLGDLYVGVGSDENHFRLKSTRSLYSQADRANMLAALECVASSIALHGEGEADFEEAIESVNPDCYLSSIYNDSPVKRALCEKHGVEYRVVDPNDFDGRPVEATPEKSVSIDTTNLYFPYRICMTGGWLDQPWVSEVHPGGVTVLGVEPDRSFMLRGGMATSTRETAKRIWSTFPSGDPVHLAEILFGAENPPGKKYISGSQDALGLCLPGYSLLHYDGGFWPTKIESECDKETTAWLESVIWMVPLRERTDGYDPLLEQDLSRANISGLARSSELAMKAVRSKSTEMLGEALLLTLDAWRKMLPLTVPDEFEPFFKKFDATAGYNMSGCGGGYLIVISDKPVEGGFQIRVRRA